MPESLGMVGVAAVIFASTNVDDVFLLAAFFSDHHLATSSVVLGQFVGIGALFVISAVAAFASLAVPQGYTALLGAVPLALGLHKVWQLRRSDGDVDQSGIQAEEVRAGRRTHSRVISVAGVTIANGGDNLGVYIPLFAREPDLIPLYGVVFAAMTALWCFAGYRLVKNQLIGEQIQRYGHIALPVVLIALGLWILSEAHVLLH